MQKGKNLSDDDDDGDDDDSDDDHDDGKCLHELNRRQFVGKNSLIQSGTWKMGWKYAFVVGAIVCTQCTVKMLMGDHRSGKVTFTEKMVVMERSAWVHFNR